MSTVYPLVLGSALPPEVLADKEGSLVRRLRDLGVLIAGKTVTEEFAYNGPIATRNPHNTEHTPGGSSAGSAAAVAMRPMSPRSRHPNLALCDRTGCPFAG